MAIRRRLKAKGKCALSDGIPALDDGSRSRLVVLGVIAFAFSDDPA